MKDRLPTKVLPNGAVRYGVYDDRGALLRYEYMLAADDPSEAGTPLSVATLLQDATAALFGLNAAAVPNDVLNWIGQYNTHWWSVLHGRESIAYDEKRTNITKNIYFWASSPLFDWTAASKTITYASAVTIDQANGAISLKNPTTVTPTNSTSGLQSMCRTLLGKYLLLANGEIYYVPSNATYGNSYSYTLHYSYDSEDGSVMELCAESSQVAVKPQIVTSQIRNIPAGEITYVHSTNRNAYTEGTDASGNVYEYLGVPFNKATTAPKIATGTYVGTGLAGSANPNTLTFDFVPKILMIQATTGSEMNFNGVVHADWVFALNGVTNVQVRLGSSQGSNSDLTITWIGNTVSWYHVGSGTSSYPPYAPSQLNTAGVTYRYFAIG